MFYDSMESVVFKKIPSKRVFVILNSRFDENKISLFYFNCIVSLLLINLAWQSTRNNIHNMFTSNSRGWDGSPIIRLPYFSYF